MTALKNFKILVLDKAPDQSIAVLLFQNPHWEVILSELGEALIQKIQGGHFNLVIQADQSPTNQFVQACIASKTHYINLNSKATASHISSIMQFNAQAQSQGVVLISGAGIFPGLSSVLVDAFLPRFTCLQEIAFGFSFSTMVLKKYLTDLGQPFRRLEQGRWKKVYGYKNLHRHYYGDNIGFRWQCNVNKPDLTLFPARYPDLKTSTVHEGCRPGFLFSKKTPAGLVMRLYGTDQRYQPLEIKWQLVAEKGHDAYIHVLPALILAKKIAAAEIAPGSYPGLGLFTLSEFDAAIAPYAIYYTSEETEY